MNVENDPTPAPRRRGLLLAAALVLSAALAFGVAALLVDIFEKKQEAQNPFFRVVEVDDRTTDPAVWGRNFPLQYDAYKRTVDQKRTRYGGSEALPRVPTEADPRSIVARSKLEEDPRLKTMWAGYAFAIAYREERGHAYMLEDQTFTGRHARPMAGTCINCHASVYVPFKEAGNGDLFAGFEKLNAMPYQEARQHVEHPISCIDCHDPRTMALRVTRPAFIEGFRAYKAAVEGVEDYDVNRDASRQEMRTFVCAQCHVEYYFKGEDKRLTFPWTRGQRADEVLAYYDDIGFQDWTHARTGAPSIKAQHPEFEMFSQGVHHRAGVACADCHMPYKRVGAVKISDHHVRSPLLNVSNACQTCHQEPEAEILERAQRVQDTTFELRNVAMDALVVLIEDIEAAQAAGDYPEATLAEAVDRQRKGQFLIDFVESENSMGFHAPQEAARVLALALDHLRRGQRALAGPPAAITSPEVPDPVLEDDEQTAQALPRQ